MQLLLRDNLPFVAVTIAYSGHTVEAKHVLIDTGSATTILSADVVARIQVVPSPVDELHIIRGIGGSEVVFSRVIDYLQIGEDRFPRFEVEIGGMDYGFQIDGILGMDLLMQMGAIINLREMQLSFES